MQTWEYFVDWFYGSIEAQQRDLDQLGAQGWELVAIQQDRFYFKRPVQPCHSCGRTEGHQAHCLVLESMQEQETDK